MPLPEPQLPPVWWGSPPAPHQEGAGLAGHHVLPVMGPTAHTMVAPGPPNRAWGPGVPRRACQGGHPTPHGRPWRGSAVDANIVAQHPPSPSEAAGQSQDRTGDSGPLQSRHLAQSPGSHSEAQGRPREPEWSRPRASRTAADLGPSWEGELKAGRRIGSGPPEPSQGLPAGPLGHTELPKHPQRLRGHLQTSDGGGRTSEATSQALPGTEAAPQPPTQMPSLCPRGCPGPALHLPLCWLAPAVGSCPQKLKVTLLP